MLAAGNYVLEFGVTNWSDTYYDSGLAFNNVTISGSPVNINESVVPVPAAAWLFASALGLAGFVRRRE